MLHVIDGLGGGGSERWVYDIVRLSDPKLVRHRVTTVHPDRGRFAYARALRELNAYGRAATLPKASLDLAPLRSGRLAGGDAVRGALRLAWLTSVVFPSGAYRALRESISFRPDVIHSHTFHGFVFGLALARAGRTPLIHTVPSLFSQMQDAGFGWLPGFYRRFHRGVDRFFTGYPDELLQIGVPSDKIREVRGGVDVDTADLAWHERGRHRARVRAALGIPESAPVALSVGRLHRSKGYELAVASVVATREQFPDMHWVVLGEGEERGAIEASARDMGVAGHSHFLGFVADVFPFYAASDVYLRTALLEAENQSSFQAMAMGLPVVGFDTGASTELVSKVGHGALVPKGDSDAFASAVADILRSADRGAGLGARGRIYALAELGTNRTVERFVRSYRELAV